jgi:anthranilate/para-aminobenzoate synthase component II
MVCVVLDNTRGGGKRFLRMLIRFLKHEKVDFEVVRTYAQLVKLSRDRIDCVISSGSDRFVSNADIDDVLMFTYVKRHALPYVGICFGAQFMAACMGLEMERMPLLCTRQMITMGGREVAISVQFCNHEWVRMVPGPWHGMATTWAHGTRRVVMFRHDTLPWVGMLFHAEAHHDTYAILRQAVRDARRRHGDIKHSREGIP